MRFLAEYDNQKSGLYDVFSKNFSLYWGVLGILQFCYFVITVIKYMILSFVVLKNN